MTRYIDADAVIEAVKDWVISKEFSYTNATYYLVKRIEELPTAEPERKTGKWIRTGRENVYGGYEVECSECGDAVMITHAEDELYCRHCGARMDG